MTEKPASEQQTPNAEGSLPSAGDIKITAIVPVYNRFSTLPRTLDSILRQTRPADEVLIVDDSSKSPVEDFLKSTGGYLDRVRVVRSETNLGCGGARNLGARMASNDWVAFLDSDDLWMDDCLARLSEHIRLNPDCHGVDGPMLYKYTNREIVRGRERHPRMRLIDAATQNQIYNQIFLVRRDVLLEVGGYDSRIIAWDDYALSLRIAGGRFNIDHVFGKPVGVHHRLGDNLSANRLIMFRDAFRILWYYRKQYRSAFGPGAMVLQTGRILVHTGNKIRKAGKLLSIPGHVLQRCIPWAPRVEDL